MPLREYLNSVGDVWLIWLGSVCLFSALVYRALRSQRWASPREFLSDERGASYAFPYVMTFPIYMLIVCFIIQGSMILLVKVGAMYAAHAAARSAVVWRSADPYSDSRGLELAESKSRDAAVLAMVPFASGYSGHQQMFPWNPFNVTARLRAEGYYQLYMLLASGTEAGRTPAAKKFVINKYLFADASTSVTINDHSNDFNEPLTVEVRFQMPIHVPGTARIFGQTAYGQKHWTGKGYYREVRATATLPLETPESEERDLGIEYDPSTL